MSKSARTALIILSAFALLNVMFVPIFDVWGGLFPSDVEYKFFDVLKMIFKDGDAWGMWVVRFTISFFVPSLLMFVASLSGKKGFFVTVNIIGILLWIRQIIEYVIDNGLEDDPFDFKDGNISIGTWVAIIIFVISLIIALSGKKAPNTIYQSQPQYYQAQPQTYQQPLETSQPPMTEQDKVNVCPKCGAKMEGGAFCTNCGTKLF